MTSHLEACESGSPQHQGARRYLNLDRSRQAPARERGTRLRVRDETKTERGATAVESAIVFSLLIVSLFAVLEFGLAFKSWLSVSHSAREAARAGATFGDNPLADMQVLDEVAQVMAPVGFAPGTQVRIFDAAPGGVGTTYTYAPGTGCGAMAGYSFPDCCDWTPCPEVGRPTYVIPVWDPSARDISAPKTDRLGVEITYSHDWITGFFASTSDFSTTTDFRLEPQVFA